MAGGLTGGRLAPTPPVSSALLLLLLLLQCRLSQAALPPPCSPEAAHLAPTSDNPTTVAPLTRPTPTLSSPLTLFLPWLGYLLVHLDSP